MSGISICNNEECLNKKICKRFKSKTLEIQEYIIKNVCNEENGYDLLIQDEVKVARIKEEEKKKEIIPPKVKKEVKKETDTNK